jgi:protease YdgD
MRLSVFSLAFCFALASPYAHAAEQLPPSPGILSPSHSTNVFGRDDRQTVTNRNAPWSAIGRLLLPDGTHCTATLVSRSLALTAAHCVMKDKALMKGNYRFQPQYSHGSTEESGVNYIWWGTTDPDTYRGLDWAILRLEKPLGDRYGWMGVRKQNGYDLLSARTYYMGGYSGDYQKGEVASWQGGFRFTHFWPASGFAWHDADTTRGASGSSIFFYENSSQPGTSAYVVSINVAEYRNGGDTSLIGVPYSEKTANVAIPSETFYDYVVEAIRQSP